MLRQDTKQLKGVCMMFTLNTIKWTHKVMNSTVAGRWIYYCTT